MSRDRTARTRIRQFLANSGPIVDPSGYATGLLKDAIGYTGSAVAFIQLIAAMDRDGELARDIRGKRTYRISGVGAAPAASIVPKRPADASAVATVVAAGQPVIELDYKLLAKALVAELLAATAAAVTAASANEVDARPAERDEYSRRLELARRHLDELLGQPIAVTSDSLQDS